MRSFTTMILLLALLLVSVAFINGSSAPPLPKHFPKPLYSFAGNPVSAEGFALGRKLFYDPILSADSTISCGTCHQHFAAFAHVDHALSHGIAGRIGTRNVPALQNLAWSRAMMWDGSIASMEQQPVNPITNANEMNERMEHVVQKLQRQPAYAAAFWQVFHDSVSSQHLLQALAQFTGSMISANARYDQYIAGKAVFDAAEKNGLQLFKAKCAQCHTPPLFTNNDYRSNGLAPDSLLNDTGRELVTGHRADRYRFKVPSLRNVALTFPYMHDGRMKRLRDVLEHYAAVNYNAANDEALLKPVGVLNDKEKKDLVAFLLTLTDQQFVTDRRFDEP